MGQVAGWQLHWQPVVPAWIVGLMAVHVDPPEQPPAFFWPTALESQLLVPTFAPATGLNARKACNQHVQ